MKAKLLIPVLAILALVSASSSWAQPNGTVSTFPGRMTQSEDEALGLKPGAGDVFSWASWDGSQLGTQWSVTCGVQYVPQVRKGDLDAKGNGTIEVTNAFLGGTFLVAGLSPWIGDAPVFGKIGRTDFIDKTTYMNFQPVSKEILVSSRGLDRFGRMVAIESTRCLGWGDMAVAVPRNYPKLVDMACQAVRTDGYWWDAGDVTITILKKNTGITVTPLNAVEDLAAPVRGTSWGAVKTLYR